MGSTSGASVDWILAALAALVVVLAAASGGEPSAGVGAREFDAGAVGLLAVGGVIVWAGGRHPATMAVTAMALTFTWYAAGYTSGFVNVVTLLAFYRLGTSDHAIRKLSVSTAAVTATMVNLAIIGDEGWAQALAASGYMLMAVLFGELIRGRRLLVAEYADRARRAEIDANRRLAEERLDIARDVHDVLAHTVAAMSVQAGVAVDALERDDRAATAAAVESIRSAGRDAMDEIRATISVLRSPSDEPARAPAPRLAQLDDLASTAQAHGLEVRIHRTLSGQPLPELVELTAVRVVQEALTNVVRHSDAAHAAVVIDQDGDTLVVEVRDDGSGQALTTTVTGAVATGAEPGFGLRGMAERVESLGGALRHGHTTTGGFVVRATFPITVPADRTEP